MTSPVSIAIALPTFNRSLYLEHCLSEHHYCLDRYDVPVYISDNASSDETESIVQKHITDYPLISYHRNAQTILPDENFEKALGYPNTDYVWLLGDTYLIPEPTFEAVNKSLQEDNYNLVVVNMGGRVKDVNEQVYTDRSKLLADLGWHMTCLSTLIYSKELLQNANYARFKDTNFLQTGIIFEYLGDRPIKVKWIPQVSVVGFDVPGVIKKSWEDQTFRIWTERWTNFIFSLPASYTLEAKLKCVMDHGTKSGLFHFSSVKRLRKKKLFNREIYCQYSRYFPFTINYPLFSLRMLASFPVWLLRLFGS